MRLLLTINPNATINVEKLNLGDPDRRLVKFVDPN